MEDIIIKNIVIIHKLNEYNYDFQDENGVIKNISFPYPINIELGSKGDIIYKFNKLYDRIYFKLKEE